MKYLQISYIYVKKYVGKLHAVEGGGDIKLRTNTLKRRTSLIYSEYRILFIHSSTFVVKEKLQ